MAAMNWEEPLGLIRERFRSFQMIFRLQRVNSDVPCHAVTVQKDGESKISRLGQTIDLQRVRDVVERTPPSTALNTARKLPYLLSQPCSLVPAGDT